MDYISSMLEEDSFLARKLRMHGLSIYPDSILFLEAFVGEEYNAKMSFRNVSRNKLILKIAKPYKQCFEINDNGSPIFLAPGLSIVKRVKFSCTLQSIKDSAFPIAVNDVWFDVPIRVKLAEPCLTVTPTRLSFGQINIGGRYLSRYLHIYNAGAEVSSFHIDFGHNTMDLIATPRMGTLEPYGKSLVRLDLAAFTPGHHCTQFWVKGCPPTVVQVEVFAQMPFLEAIHPNMTARFTLIEFEPTYYGTIRYETLAVCNKSVRPTTFVILAEIENNLMTLEEVGNVHPEKVKHYKNFSVEPMGGNLQPYESRIFTVWFHPTCEVPDKGWMQDQPTQDEYLCFLRVFQVDVRDSTDKYQDSIEEESDFLNLRLCVHGTAEKPQIGVLTSSFVFNEVSIGEKVTRVIHLKNLSDPPVFCRFLKVPGFEVRPPEKLVQGGKAAEIELIFKPTSLGIVKNCILFDILSYENLKFPKEKIVLGQLKIPISAHVKAQKTCPKPRFNMGITPKLAHEVGDHIENIKFCDSIEKPSMMLLPPPSDKKPWLRSDACIAFPYDLARTFRIKPTDHLTRTIYTGKKRYVVPIDRNNTYTLSEFLRRKAHHESYAKFLDKEGKRKLESILKADNDVFYWKATPTELRWYKNVEWESVLKASTKALTKKTVNLDIHEVIPLSPKDLYNVVISPKNLDFGKIPIDVDCSRDVSVENLNTFPVLVNLQMQKDTNGINNCTFVVKPKKRVMKSITLNISNFGKYFSMLTFRINNDDCFDMNVIADVVQRSLTIVPHEVNIFVKNEDIFSTTWIPVRLVNQLYVPTSFVWKVPFGCSYWIEPKTGTVPGQRDICCALYFGPNLERQSSSFLTLQVEGGNNVELRISRTQDRSHNVIVMTKKKMLPPLSCNLIHVDTALFFNFGYREAIFSVINPNPIEGVTISPIAGVIPSKSCIGIDVEFQMTCIRAFDFNLSVRIQFKNILEVKYVGFVFFPNVQFTPTVLPLRNIPCYSYTTYNIKAENIGQCPVKIHFDMKDDFPQVHISESKKINQCWVMDDQEFYIPPGSFKEIYLHLNPQTFATYEFLLPVVFNGGIGPPRLYDEQSQNPLTYVRAVLENSIVKYIDLSFPSILTSTKIDVSIGRGYILFSCWTVNFNVYAKDEIGKKSITVKNLINEESSVFIDPRIFYSNYAYEITNFPKDGIYIIPPLDEIDLEICFNPVADVTNDLEIPIYVKEYSPSTPYNYLQLNGFLQAPIITVSENFIQFLPVPTGVSIERLIIVTCKYQPTPTALTTSFKRLLGADVDILDRLEFIYPKGNQIPVYNGKETIIPVIVKFKSKKFVSQQGSFIFLDEFDATCEVSFSVCADNSISSCYNYIFLCQQMLHKQQHKATFIEDKERICKFKVGDFEDNQIDSELLKDILDFPKFPRSNNSSGYARKIRGVVTAMETWLFEQCFTGSFRFIIGNHLAFSKAFASGQSKQPQHEYIKSVIDLLYVHIGRDLFLEYQLPTSVPSDNIERITYSLNIYRQILKFLQVQGGNVSHLFPVYLLTYDDYCTHLNDIKLKTNDTKTRGKHYEEIFEEICSKKTLLGPEEFERYSKQAWLDLILQIHRCIVQSGTPFVKEYNICLHQFKEDISLTSSESFMASESNLQLFGHEKLTVFGSNRPLDRGDKALVDWLNFTYVHVRNRHPELNIPHRVVIDMFEDLEDAVVLCATTIFYCPYLIEDYFSNFFFEPSDSNQVHHNATQLCIAWSSIKLGLTVKPSDFYDLNQVFMVVLVTHMYRVMRSYIPDRTIEFLACLTTSVTRKVTISNPNESTIGYSVKIIGDYSKVFKIEGGKQSILISARTSARLSITFSAKKLTPVKAILLLCGSCVPNSYVENLVLTLYGDPYNLVVSRDYTVIAPIMKPVFVITKICSPYDVEAEYEVWFADEEPKAGVLNIRPWSEVKRLKVPRSIFLGYDKLVVPPPGSASSAVLSMTAACFTRSILHFWIILKNDEVGDFIIRVILKPQIEMPSLILKVPLPVGLCTGYPGSLCSSRCPRIIPIRIPSRNTRLWNSVKTMLLLTMNKEEISFWQEHYETRIGLDLMKWLLGKSDTTETKEIGFIFESKVRYKVTSLSPHINVQEIVEIDDIHSREFVELFVHLCCRINSEFCAEILLESESGQEVRLYQLKFCGDYPKEKCIEECRKGCNFNEVIPTKTCFTLNS